MTPSARPSANCCGTAALNPRAGASRPRNTFSKRPARAASTGLTSRSMLVTPSRSIAACPSVSWTGTAPAGSSYVFNAAGQVIDLGGLLCLFDAEGPCANAVKDAQRTKTTAATRRTLTLLWGTTALPGRAAAAEAWYRGLLEGQGATTA